MTAYGDSYFKEDIFSTDYPILAKNIVSIYQPKRVIEVGCGPGHLTRSLAKLNLEVTAIDGFSTPDFSDYPKINFTKVDLNNSTEMKAFLDQQLTFDLAICTEVAEHLLPESSAHLVGFLTALAPIIIFSAAVPNQGGNGHINCRSRGFWHELFAAQGYRVRDSLRETLRSSENLAVWYKLNILDYVKEDQQHGNDGYLKIIDRLIASESHAAELFYHQSTETNKLAQYLKYPGVKQYFGIRNQLKKLFR
ncbi:MAG: methyltransferase domain-containing protein [Pedobacter sp.]|nr:methyltransferase domain-containing protein [Pedobacter sp.]MDQ8053947.1 methyltransferase domain-containing protein [Pedobacter sp.]